MKNQTAAMQKSQKSAAIAKPMKPTHKPVTLKNVMILDTGDGAFTDAAVKVRPHDEDPNKLVLKCVSIARLADAITRMGVTLIGAPFKGNKHFIAVVWKKGFGDALLAQGQQQAAPALTAPKAKQLHSGKK